VFVFLCILVFVVLFNLFICQECADDKLLAYVEPNVCLILVLFTVATSRAELSKFIKIPLMANNKMVKAPISHAPMNHVQEITTLSI